MGSRMDLAEPWQEWGAGHDDLSQAELFYGQRLALSSHPAARTG